MNTFFTYFFVVCFLLTGFRLPAQETGLTTPNPSLENTDPLHIARKYISAHLSDWGLTSDDIADMVISDMYTDKGTGITRIYFLQRYEGIPVFNAILNVCMTREGTVYYATSRFVPGLKNKVNTAVPLLTPAEAVTAFASHLGHTTREVKMKTSVKPSQFLFDKAGIAREDVTVELSYQPYEGRVLLAWDMLFAPEDNHDLWSARIDAVTGAMLHKSNWTLYCNANAMDFSLEENDQKEIIDTASSCCHTEVFQTEIPADPGTGAQYNVWPQPYESPVDGPRTMVTDPQDPIASPFGWHDINGQPGPEYTITRGNNVYAYQDRDDLGYSSGDEPDGGPELKFDFPFDPSLEPEHYVDAAVVNLFYWINFMHDFSYRFGFTEETGNFQKNNYGHGGLDNDFVWAVAQSGANTDSLHNNAKFVNRPEGTPPTIFCNDFYLFPDYINVESPASVAGGYYACLPSPGWGAGSYLTDVPLTAEVVLVNDGVDEPSIADACQEIINTSEVAGKIVLIERGNCQFAFKALQAQNAGAIGVIFLNFENKLATLAAGPDAPNVHIPVVMMYLHDARIIRQYAGHGLTITLRDPGISHPHRLDADLQNTIIAHEYGHGISLRLAGGPNKVCMDNAEQMGEGWSDFFALVTSVNPGDTGEKKRGLNTYVHGESDGEKGSRFYPFSTDMSVSPLTYAHINSHQEVHERGEVWAAMLWDMYWAMVDRYGWSPDLYDESSGNYMAIRLVMDGLKNMACDPGFVDARNAIIAADEVLYSGENYCLLWEVFARRGLGYSADQGSSNDPGDQIEAFDLPPVCTNKISIEKTVTDFIQPGDDIQVTIKVGNYKNETISNVVVTDIIPEGTSFKPNSSNYGVLQQGNKLLFDLGNMNFQKENSITYTLRTSPEAWSDRKFLDEVPDENNTFWISHTIGATATNLWHITDTLSAHSGYACWNTREAPEKSQQALILDPDVYAIHVDGEHPTIRFYHRYQTQAGINGGIVEVREVGTSPWTRVNSELIRNGYRGPIDYSTFILDKVQAFTGFSNDTFKASYVDLSPWMGKDVQIRFRFGTITNTHAGAGWMIDDIEYMELLAYNEEVCVTTDQGDFECTIAPEHGTIVDSRENPVSTAESISTLSSKIYPNPATDLVTIAMSTDHLQDIEISLQTLDGKQLFAQSFSISGNEFVNLQTQSLPSGIYLIKVNSGAEQYVEKLIIQKM